MPIPTKIDFTRSARCKESASLDGSGPTKSVWPIAVMSGACLRAISASRRFTSCFDCSVNSGAALEVKGDGDGARRLGCQRIAEDILNFTLACRAPLHAALGGGLGGGVRGVEQDRKSVV